MPQLWLKHSTTSLWQLLVIYIVILTLIPLTKIISKDLYLTIFPKTSFQQRSHISINEMKTNKSTGPNSIPTQILKISNQIMCKPLTYLIDLSFSNGIFPDLLKTSNVIPIFKRAENQDYNNYQPISLISNLSKLMEKIVHPRLYSFLERNSLLYERQHGFRNKLSTNHALMI